MKNALKQLQILSFTIFATILSYLSCSADEPDENTFIENVNEAWRDEQYNKIFELAEQEVNGEVPSAEGYSVLFRYWLIVRGDADRALETLSEFVEVFEEIDRDFHEARAEAVAEYQKVHNDHLGANPEPLTKDQIDEILEFERKRSPEEFEILIPLNWVHPSKWKWPPAIPQ